MTAGLTLAAEPYDGPAGRELVEAVQQEYVLRYGGPDATPVDPRQFDPPDGLFLVARWDDRPVGCVGARRLAAGVAEMKRMFVAAGYRRRGIASALLARLEADAARAGYRELRLETGGAQPEAWQLYLRAGYTPVEAFGVYSCHTSARYLGRALTSSG